MRCILAGSSHLAPVSEGQEGRPVRRSLRDSQEASRDAATAMSRSQTSTSQGVAEETKDLSLSAQGTNLHAQDRKPLRGDSAGSRQAAQQDVAEMHPSSTGTASGESERPVAKTRSGDMPGSLKSSAQPASSSRISLDQGKAEVAAEESQAEADFHDADVLAAEAGRLAASTAAEPCPIGDGGLRTPFAAAAEAMHSSPGSPLRPFGLLSGSLAVALVSSGCASSKKTTLRMACVSFMELLAEEHPGSPPGLFLSKVHACRQEEHPQSRYRQGLMRGATVMQEGQIESQRGHAVAGSAQPLALSLAVSQFLGNARSALLCHSLLSHF